MNLSYIFKTFIVSIPQIVVIIFCFRYYTNTKSKNALFLGIGSIMVLIDLIFSSFSIFLLTKFSMEPLTAGILGGISNLIGLTGAFFFAFGLRKFFKKAIALISKVGHSSINHIGHS